LVCEQASVQSNPTDSTAWVAEANAKVNAVLDSMRGELLACYKTRLHAKPTAHGFITVTIVIAPDGTVRRTETTGGAILGEATMACITNRIKRAKFEPPKGGGTLTVVAPFGLRKAATGDDI
jgi:hypothetical protein